MPLPSIALFRQTINVGGTDVSVRALSRAEAMQLSDYKDRLGEAEVFILMCGTGCTEEEAKEFRQNNSVETAGLLVDGILALSGIAGDDDPKAGSNEPS